MFYRNIAIYKSIIFIRASKSDNFSEGHHQLATLFKALSHPARIAIVEYLLIVNTCICSDIVNKLPLAQPTVSQHLSALKNAGIIKVNIEGTAICYRLNMETLQKIEDYFFAITKKLEGKYC